MSKVLRRVEDNAFHLAVNSRTVAAATVIFIRVSARCAAVKNRFGGNFIQCEL